MSTTTMAFTISVPTRIYCSSSSFTPRKPTLYTISNSTISQPKIPNIHFSTWIPQMVVTHFSPWNGLRQLGISTSQQSIKIERRGKCKGKGVFASLFGVGAPEALVIGVVALLVFGPKGLAEVARNLGKTLRAFQPTIRELQEVSREFKSTLEREIGLDDIQNSTENSSRSNTANTTSSPSSIATLEDSQKEVDPTDGSPSLNRAYSSDEYLMFTEEQLKGSVGQPQRETTSPEERQFEPPPSPPQSSTVQESAAVTTPSNKTESEI